MLPFDHSLPVDDISDWSEPFLKHFVFERLKFSESSKLLFEYRFVEEMFVFLVLVMHGIIGLCASINFFFCYSKVWSVHQTKGLAKPVKHSVKHQSLTNV